MRRLSLVVAQFGSFIMVLVSVYFAFAALFSGESVWGSLLLGLAGVLYWTAMFYVFGAVDDYLKERAQRAPASVAAPIPWAPSLGRPVPGEVSQEYDTAAGEDRPDP